MGAVRMSAGTAARIALISGLAALSLATGRGSAVSAAGSPVDGGAIRHLLDRVAFGARPGDVERVGRMGVDRYLDEQLHPERLADRDVSARLSALPTLTMSSRELAATYERPAMEARQRQARAMEAGNVATGSVNAGADRADASEMDPEQAAIVRRGNRMVVELAEAKLLRAVYSERQLQEVLADFWFNHFNVDARKGADRVLLTAYDRDTIRPRVFGRFRDLLEATAKSPAMLFYLDNWQSVDPNGPHGPARTPGPRSFAYAGFPGPRGGGFLVPPRATGATAGRPRGLNENYGRELMELHTLGVDGGYTQKDVTEVARAFTGWTIQQPQQGGEFRFEPRFHDTGAKVVLGHRIAAGGGVEDGEQVLDILSAHPSTARFIATELVRRFVSDVPPSTLVDRAAARFRETDGDLREVMRTILTSPEFRSPDAYRVKVKTPFEFVVSAIRGIGADVNDPQPLVRAVQQLGMPLFECQPPTGYKDTAEAWINGGALVARMNFAVAVSANQLRGVTLSTTTLLGTSDPGPDLTLARGRFVDALLGPDVSASTLTTIGKASSVPQIAALTLGAPEFQQR